MFSRSYYLKCYYFIIKNIFFKFKFNLHLQLLSLCIYLKSQTFWPSGFLFPSLLVMHFVTVIPALFCCIEGAGSQWGNFFDNVHQIIAKTVNCGFLHKLSNTRVGEGGGAWWTKQFNCMHFSIICHFMGRCKLKQFCIESKILYIEIKIS